MSLTERRKLLKQVWIEGIDSVTDDPKGTAADRYLDELMEDMSEIPARVKPGVIILGFGAGRCGSTSLAATLSQLPDSVSTHENPGRISWVPKGIELSWHIQRLRMLASRHAYVIDVAPWWINAIGYVFAALPNSRAIALYRDPMEITESMLKTTAGRRLFLDEPENPGLPWPSHPMTRPECGMDLRQHFLNYVIGYQAQAPWLRTIYGDRVQLMAMEKLNDSKHLDALAYWCGAQPKLDPVEPLNVKTFADGLDEMWWA